MNQTNTTPKPWIINATNLVTIGSKVALECRPSALFSDLFAGLGVQPISTFDVFKPDSDILGYIWGYNSNNRTFAKIPGGFRLHYGNIFDVSQTNPLIHCATFTLINGSNSILKTQENTTIGNAGTATNPGNRKGLLSFGAASTNAFIGRFQEHIQYEQDLSSIANLILQNQKNFYGI
jgi:hypothetical protein